LLLLTTKKERLWTLEAFVGVGGPLRVFALSAKGSNRGHHVF
jgi:hypothetical protein